MQKKVLEKLLEDFVQMDSKDVEYDTDNYYRVLEGIKYALVLSDPGACEKQREERTRTYNMAQGIYPETPHMRIYELGAFIFSSGVPDGTYVFYEGKNYFWNDGTINIKESFECIDNVCGKLFEISGGKPVFWSDVNPECIKISLFPKSFAEPETLKEKAFIVIEMKYFMSYKVHRPETEKMSEHLSKRATVEEYWRIVA